MEGDYIKINKWLLPLSWLYGLGVELRNILFDVGILKSRSFKFPIISVGNITVGGTGKTPHVEYLIELLRNQFKVAVLSRGYKRQTRGYLLADKNATYNDIGDEPYQMKMKYDNILVAVDPDRVHGIQELTQANSDLDVILLDDAFQHRYVKPGINILLVDYHRLIIYDALLPAGRLREPLKGKDRADIVIITKCPKELKPMEYRVITKAVNLYPYQQLYFTTLRYGQLQPTFTDCIQPLSLQELAGYHILLLTGIASPQQIIEDLQPTGADIQPLTFPDHHNFNKKDIQTINDAFARLSEPRCIITTEKDATRLYTQTELSSAVKEHLYTLPVKIEFMLEQENQFNQNIIGYVRKNSRNSILAKAKDDHKSQDRHYFGHGTRTISFRNN